MMFATPFYHIFFSGGIENEEVRLSGLWLRP